LEYLPGAALYLDKKTMLTAKKPIIFVYYLGGVTYGEVTTLRWLAKKYSRI
jgi:hypothetical protein